ncbi:MAG: hypothetical protein Tsb0019_09020 [Roseibium sp.]
MIFRLAVPTVAQCDQAKDTGADEMVDLRAADPEKELSALVAFLCGHSWRFHGTPDLSEDEAKDLLLADAAATLTFWIEADGERAGLLRVLDLDDIGDGSPVFDLRVAEDRRSRGIGTEAVRQMCRMLFARFPDLHRIEATTRHDNHGMQKILVKNGFLLEGRLRKSWKTTSRSWCDTMIFGLLRDDFVRSERNQFSSLGRTDMANEDELMVRHNRRLDNELEDDDDLGLELRVRHNRPAADIELMVRHNRRLKELGEGGADDDDLDDDEDVVLLVRHNRRLATDLDVELMVRHNRRLTEDDTGEALMVRHNRPRIEVDDDIDAELRVRHNRPLAPDEM